MIALLAGDVAWAQETGATPEVEPRVHFSYAHQGTGYFSVSERSTQVVRVPISWRLRPAEPGRWGIKLRLPVSLGVHDFELERPLGPELREKVETVAVTPGVEFELVVRDNWRLKPYAELGVGAQISGDVQAVLWEAGVNSLWLIPRESVEVRWGTAVKGEGFRLFDGIDRDSYGVAEVGLETRWPGSFRIGGREADPGAYLMVRRFLPALEFLQVDGDRFKVRTQLEAGITFGTRPDLSVGGLKLPRIGLAYRWGDGLKAIRLNFGFPF